MNGNNGAPFQQVVENKVPLYPVGLLEQISTHARIFFSPFVSNKLLSKERKRKRPNVVIEKSLLSTDNSVKGHVL